MSAEKGRHQLPGSFVIQFGDRLQAFQFVGQRQAVTALDFDGGHAKGKHAFKSSSSGRLQFFLASPANLLDGGVNAASAAGDFFVSPALQALLELVLPRAGEHQMRVTIDEAGEYDLPAGIDDFSIGRDWR